MAHSTKIAFQFLKKIAKSYQDNQIIMNNVYPDHQCVIYVPKTDLFLSVFFFFFAVTLTASTFEDLSGLTNTHSVAFQFPVTPTAKILDNICLPTSRKNSSEYLWWFT